MIHRLIAIFAVVALWATPVVGWGHDGHRIVGEIAWLELPRDVRARIEALLPSAPYDSLAEAATWADRYARRHDRYAWLAELHYVDVPWDAAGYDDRRDCARGACVVAAIDRFRERLGDESEDEEDRRLALYMLAHLVGDVHLPVHVSHPDGHGGNRTYVQFFGENKKIHWVWDSGLLARRLRWVAGDGPAWRSLAHELHAALVPAERAALRAERAAASWADESLALARGDALAIGADDVIGDDDLRAAAVVIDARLTAAGVRLAAALESALATTAPVAPPPIVAAREAHTAVGGTATVCGRVDDAAFARSVRGKPTFLNLGGSYPNHAFTIVIWEADRARFGRPEVSLLGAQVCVTGRVETHRGKPQVVVSHPDQLVSLPPRPLATDP